MLAILQGSPTSTAPIQGENQFQFQVAGWQWLQSDKMLYMCEKCKNIVQVLCQLVKGENNFTFEFLGVKVQESKKNKISKRSILCI